MTYCVMNKKYKAIFATEKTLHSRKKKNGYIKKKYEFLLLLLPNNMSPVDHVLIIESPNLATRNFFIFFF